MADLATKDDVEENYRALRGQELVNVPAWIAAAQAQLRSEVLGLDTWVEADPEHAIAIKAKVVEGVLRRLGGRWESEWTFTMDEIIRVIAMVSGTSDGADPVGSFPDVVCYPVF